MKTTIFCLLTFLLFTEKIQAKSDLLSCLETIDKSYDMQKETFFRECSTYLILNGSPEDLCLCINRRLQKSRSKFYIKDKNIELFKKSIVKISRKIFLSKLLPVVRIGITPSYRFESKKIKSHVEFFILLRWQIIPLQIEKENINFKSILRELLKI